MTAAEKIRLRRAIEGVRYSLDSLQRAPSLVQIPATLATARNVLVALTDIVEVLVTDAVLMYDAEKGGE